MKIIQLLPRRENRVPALMGGSMFVGLIFLLVAGMFLTIRNKNRARGMYKITIYEGNRRQTFFSDSIISQKGNCIEFYTMIGTRETVCADMYAIAKHQ